MLKREFIISKKKFLWPSLEKSTDSKLFLKKEEKTKTKKETKRKLTALIIVTYFSFLTEILAKKTIYDNGKGKKLNIETFQKFLDQLNFSIQT